MNERSTVLEVKAVGGKDSRPWEDGSSRIQFRYILLVVACAVVLGFPLLRYGPLTDGHDTHEHLNFIKNFSAQFWHGDLYPRWLMDMNKGLGSPSFFVFPPVPGICGYSS